MEPIDPASAAFEENLTKSRASFEGWTSPLAMMQAHLAAWEARNFGAVPDYQHALGVAEEAGELCHAVLKNAQKIRGMADRDAYRAAVADAIADIAVFSMNLCTALRLDFSTLVLATAEKVMLRDWTNDRERGGEAPTVVTCAHGSAPGKCPCPDCPGRGGHHGR